MLKRSWWGIEDAMRTIKCYCKKSLGTEGRWPCEGVDKVKSFKVKDAKTAVQLLSHVWLFATPWTAPHQASLSFTMSWSLLKLMSIESVILSRYLIFCCPLILLPSIFPSTRVFSSESVLHIRWQSIGVSTSASVLLMNIQDWFPLRWSRWSPRDSQESSPAPQFESIYSSALSLLDGVNENFMAALN